MTAEQILTALRFVAMGRPNHPDVRALASFLAKPEPVAPEEIEPEQAEDKPRRGRKPKAE